MGFDMGVNFIPIKVYPYQKGWFGWVRKCRGVHEHGERAELTALGLSSFADGKGYSQSQCLEAILWYLRLTEQLKQAVDRL